MGTPIFFTSLTDRLLNNLIDSIGTFNLGFNSDKAQIERLAYEMAHNNEFHKHIKARKGDDDIWERDDPFKKSTPSEPSVAKLISAK